MSDPIRYLLDREEIRDCMARYARGVDRGDWEAVRATYHADAFDDHGDYKGDIDGFISFASARTGSLPQVMHFLGQSLIEFADADTAIVETYFMTAHTLDAAGRQAYGTVEDGTVQLSAMGRYADRFERRDDVWRVAHRIVIFEATRIFTNDVPPLRPDWAHRRRDLDDPIYVLRREAGLDV